MHIFWTSYIFFFSHLPVYCKVTGCKRHTHYFEYIHCCSAVTNSSTNACHTNADQLYVHCVIAFRLIFTADMWLMNPALKQASNCCRCCPAPASVYRKLLLVFAGAMQQPLFATCCRALIACKSCMDEWIRIHTTCPKCRHVIIDGIFLPAGGLHEVIRALAAVVP